VVHAQHQARLAGSIRKLARPATSRWEKIPHHTASSSPGRRTVGNRFRFERQRARRPEDRQGRSLSVAKGTPNVNLNTATFDNAGILWFTGQVGYYGRLIPKQNDASVRSPRGRGPYGICTAPDGSVYYARSPVRTSRASTPKPARPLSSSRPPPIRARPCVGGFAKPHLGE